MHYLVAVDDEMRVSLFDQIVKDQDATRTHDLCTVAKIKTELDGDDATDLQRALDARSGGTWMLTGVAIANSLNKVLGERAHGIKGPTVQRHRRGLCGCRGEQASA